MNRTVLFLILTSLMLVVFNCHKPPCIPKDSIPQKRVIINASGVEVTLKGIAVTYQNNEVRGTIIAIPTDTTDSFTYTIADGDSLISIEACSYSICPGRWGGTGPSECRNVVGGFRFFHLTDGELIFANRRVQTFKYRDSLSIFSGGQGYSVIRSDSDSIILAHTITPEAYEKARPLNP